MSFVSYGMYYPYASTTIVIVDVQAGTHVTPHHAQRYRPESRQVGWCLLPKYHKHYGHFSTQND